MDLSDIELQTGLDGLDEMLERERPGPEFALKSNLFLFKKEAAKDYASRAGIRDADTLAWHRAWMEELKPLP